MTGPDIIAAFGDRHILSRITGAKPTAVTQWRRIGVPSKYWHTLVDEAKRRRIAGITFEALKNSKPGRAA